MVTQAQFNLAAVHQRFKALGVPLPDEMVETLKVVGEKQQDDGNKPDDQT